MDQLWHFFDGCSTHNSVFTPGNVALSLLVAFVLGQVLAWVYYGTHTGLSYSRSFVQSLILIAIVVALVMAVIGNNIITAFGLMGALAIVRFRNVIKDTRDVVFLFCSLVIGMAAGSQRFSVAILGTVVLCAVAIYLHASRFGAHCSHNAFLRFSLARSTTPDDSPAGVLKRFCSRFSLISVQEGSLDGTG